MFEKFLKIWGEFWFQLKSWGKSCSALMGFPQSFQLQRNNSMEMRVYKSQNFRVSFKFLEIRASGLSWYFAENYLKNPSRFKQTRVQDKILHNHKKQENKILSRKLFKSNPLRLLFITLYLKQKIDVIIFAIYSEESLKLSGMITNYLKFNSFGKPDRIFLFKIKVFNFFFSGILLQIKGNKRRNFLKIQF